MAGEPMITNERLMEFAPGAVKNWGTQSRENGVACFTKIGPEGGTYPYLSASCHYYARYSTRYAGLITTTYANYPNSYLACHNKYKDLDGQYWVDYWVEALVSVLNDPNSMYYILRDKVQVYEEKGKPKAWVINGDGTDHIVMTSFLVLTRRVKERVTPIYFKIIKDKYPDINPMIVLHLAEMITRYTSTVEDKNLGVRLYWNRPIQEITVDSGHTMCTYFTPFLHTPVKEKPSVVTSTLKETHSSTLSGTYDYLQSVDGNRNWTETKEASEFLKFIQAYNTESHVVKPMWHTVQVPDGGLKTIPLDDFIPVFVKFIKEMTK